MSDSRTGHADQLGQMDARMIHVENQMAQECLIRQTDTSNVQQQNHQQQFHQI